MKFTEKEQVLIFLLVLIMVGVGGTKWILLPAKAHRQELQVQLQEKREKEEEAKKLMLIAETIDQDILEASRTSKAKSRPFFKRAETEYVHKWISMLAESNTLMVQNLGLERENLTVLEVYGKEFVPISYPIGDYYNDIVNAQGKQTKEEQEAKEALDLREDDGVIQMKVVVKVSGTNNQLMSFADYLSNIGKHIIVNNFAFEDRQSTDIQEAELSLTIYCINKDEEDIFKGYFLETSGS